MISIHGQKVKYHHEIVGVNSRLDTLQAAVLNVKLKYLDEYTRKRNEVATYYDRALASCSFLQLPYRSAFSTHAFHQYTVKTTGIARDDFKKYLKDKGIPSMIYYPVPAHRQKMFDGLVTEVANLPVTDWLTERVISLPIHTELEEDQLSHITQTVLDFFKK